MTDKLAVLDYIKEKGSIMSREARDSLGVDALRARISELKAQGHPITSKMVKVEKRGGRMAYVAKYIWEGA